jgi:hypothetical protein
MTQPRILTIAGLALALVLSAAVTAKADSVIYSDPADVGNQGYVGALGQDFTVNSPITITQLGVFDSGQDGIAGTIRVAIFSSNGTQVTPTLTFTSTTTGTTLIGGDLFLTLSTPITLAPGSYSLTTLGWGPSDPDGNASCTAGCNGAAGASFTPPTLNTDGGAITFTGVGFTSPVLEYVGPVGTYPANQYDAGSFIVSTPEPGVMLSLMLGLGLLLFIGYRRQAFQL